MGRALTFLARSGLAAGAAVFIISTGIGTSDAAPAAHPADTPVACGSAVPLAGTVCDILVGVTNALLPGGSTVVSTPPLPVPDLPIPSLPLPAPLDGGLNVNVPIQLCNITANVLSSADGTCPAGGSSVGPSITPGTGGGINITAPIQVCGVAVGGLDGVATGGCPATGPSTASDGGTGGLINIAAPIQVCGVSVGARDAGATGACPATGPTAMSGTGGGLVNLGIAPQVCGVAVGAIDSAAVGDCPTSGPTSGGGTGGGLINVNVPVTVCGVTAGAVGGSGNGSCPESAPTTTVPATTPTTIAGTTPTTVAGSTPTTATPGDDLTASTLAEQLGPEVSASPGVATENEPPSGGGDGSLPITGISITVLVAGAAVLLQSGLLARTIANRKLRRTAA